MRRTLLRLTTKDVNKFAVAILKMFETVEPNAAGDRLAAFLSEQTAETRIWPSDSRLAADLPGLRVYGSLRQDRIRVALAAIEQHLRDQNTLYESIQLPAGLEIEHVMPQGWRTHWDEDPKLDPEAAAARDHRVNTIGNLTLVTKSLNGSLSNRPWTDGDASGLKDGGAPDRGKWSLLNDFSLLVLNKEILSNHPARWTDDAVVERSKRLTAAICEVWPGPLVEIQDAALQGSSAPPAADLSELPWTDADVERLADEAGPTMLIVLDTLATEPVRGWQNSEFVDAGLTKWGHSALGALTLKARGSFARSNPPVLYRVTSTGWVWSVSDEFAAMWRHARSQDRR